MHQVFDQVLLPIIVVIAAVVGAVIVTLLARAILIRTLHKVPAIKQRTAALRLPTTASIAAIAIEIVLNSMYGGHQWMRPVNFLLPLVLFASLAWLAVVLLASLEVGVIHRYRKRIRDERKINKVRTQVVLLRRVATAVIITLAVSGMLLTIPQVRALGAGVLASAGLISVVAGLAVQSTLANVFAGLQLAFTDQIRVDDVVIIDKLYGNVEEITLTYVVVLLDGGSRYILPSTYFTTTPFENWSRRNPEMIGKVYWDLDWSVPIPELRAELNRILKSTDLWDGRAGSFLATDAINGAVQVRAYISARNADDVWSLRCLVREKIVEFVQKNYPGAILRQRWEDIDPQTSSTPSGRPQPRPGRPTTVQRS